MAEWGPGVNQLDTSETGDSKESGFNKVKAVIADLFAKTNLLRTLRSSASEPLDVIEKEIWYNETDCGLYRRGANESELAVLNQGIGVNIRAFGAIGDYDTSTKTGTDNYQAFVNAVAKAELSGQPIIIPPGNYRLSQSLVCHEGISFIGIGSTGTQPGRGPNITFDHTNDGIVWDGNYSSSAHGVGVVLENLNIYRAPLKNGGAALKFVSTVSGYSPGWIKLKDIHILGSGASKGEGLHDRGIVIDGTNADIGLKNISMFNVAVTGCKIADEYIKITDGVQINWTDGYITNATASYPNGGSPGITIDSDTIVQAGATSDLIFISNVLITGNIKLGRVDHIYFSNCWCQSLIFTSTGAGCTWDGGIITTGKPTYVAGNTLFLDSQSYKVAQYDKKVITANTQLSFWEVNTVVCNSGATSEITIELPSTTYLFQYDLINVENQNMKVYPTLIASSNKAFEGMTNGKYINLKNGAHVRIWNSPDGSNVKWEVIKGQVELQEYTNSTATGYAYNNFSIVNKKDLTGNITFTPVQGNTMILNPTAARTITPLNTDVYPGYRLLICNINATYVITFDPTGVNTAIAANSSKEFLYTGSTWIVL